MPKFPKINLRLVPQQMCVGEEYTCNQLLHIAYMHLLYFASSVDLRALRS